MAKLTYRLAGLSRLPTGEQQEEFLIATSGIVLQPEMLFIMARGE